MLAELRKGKKPEWLALLVFVAGYAVISYFHEPWFDEAQAWQVAKYSSLKELLFVVPHYEGHPPLWHLILAIPAKLGVPYELGLKTVGFVFSLASVCLILFRSPYPRVIRLLLPFNYFIFYQYGIIVRPYGLMIFLLLLLAIAFPSRNEHPWRFIGVLMLLCITHAYGIMIAGGVALCLVWDLIQEKGFKVFFRELFKDRRTLSLGVLLALAILLYLEIRSYSDTYVATAYRTVPVWQSLLCMLFACLPDCLFLRSEWFTEDRVLLQCANFNYGSFVSAILVGAILWFALVCIGSRKNLKYLIVPFAIFAAFGGIVYMTAHHMGVALGLLMFWLWIDLQAEDRFYVWNRLRPKLLGEQEQSKFVTIALRLAVLACLVIPIYWSASSSVHDVGNDYGYGRSLAAFLKETGLEDTNIFNSWSALYGSSSEDGSDGLYLTPSSDPTILAYFDENILANMRCQNDGMPFRFYKTVSQEEYISICSSWASLGVPDVIIGNPDMELVYGDELSLLDYTVVQLFNVNYYYKDRYTAYSFPVWVRNDLLDQYGLEAADTSGMTLPIYEIPKSLVDACRDGELTVEDLLDYTIGDFGN